MFLSCAHRRFTLWIAALAFLLAAVAPALGHALGGGTTRTWVEICTAQGAQLVALDEQATDGGPGQLPAAHLLDHCPCCSIHTDSLGLPSSPVLGLPAPLLPALLPPAYLHAARTSHVWLSAQPRAPPPRFA